MVCRDCGSAYIGLTNLLVLAERKAGGELSFTEVRGRWSIVHDKPLFIVWNSKRLFGF